MSRSSGVTLPNNSSSSPGRMHPMPRRAQALRCIARMVGDQHGRSTPETVPRRGGSEGRRRFVSSTSSERRQNGGRPFPNVKLSDLAPPRVSTAPRRQGCPLDHQVRATLDRPGSWSSHHPNRLVRDFTRMEAQTYIDDLPSAPPGEHEVAPQKPWASRRSVNNVLASLRQMFKWAIRQGSCCLPRIHLKASPSAALCQGRQGGL